MRTLRTLFENNRQWAAWIRHEDPSFFGSLAAQQSPRFLWIGCSDSRVPASQIVGLLPGEMFVHRNVANLVQSSDMNCLSVLQFAVDVLRVGDVIVCGHYGCGGVQAALDGDPLGLVDNWLGPLRSLAERHEQRLHGIRDPARRAGALAELNVIAQAKNVADSSVLRAAWDRGQRVAVHGWIYGVEDGLLHDLDVTTTDVDEAHAVCEAAITRVGPAPVR